MILFTSVLLGCFGRYQEVEMYVLVTSSVGLLSACFLSGAAEHTHLKGCVSLTLTVQVAILFNVLIRCPVTPSIPLSTWEPQTGPALAEAYLCDTNALYCLQPCCRAIDEVCCLIPLY